MERRRRRRRRSNEAGEQEKEQKQDEKKQEEEEGERASAGGGDLDGVRSFTFERDDDFPEISQFVSQADREHGLQLERITSPAATGNG